MATGIFGAAPQAQESHTWLSPAPFLLFSVTQELVRLFGTLLESFSNHRLPLMNAFPSTTPRKTKKKRNFWCFITYLTPR